MNWLRQLLATISYVTIIPLRRFSGEDDLVGLAKFLPAAGALIGLLLAACFLAMQTLSVQPFLSATIIVVTWLIVTGGLHFDGLMDSADGISSHTKPERMLEIMQDSRVGNFAVIVGICTIILKIAALATLISTEPARLPLILLLAPCLARLGETYAICRYKYARQSGKGKIWHETSKFPQDIFLAATVPATIILIALFRGQSSSFLLTYLAITIAATTSSAAYFNKVLGGHTGDTYGALVEIVETLPLVAFALFVGRC